MQRRTERKARVDESSSLGSWEAYLSSSEEGASWISWFCALEGNEFLCEVDEDYIRDGFNLCGLETMVPFYAYALDVILDDDDPGSEVDGCQQAEIKSAAKLLYGLIHARFILTSRGLSTMHEKYWRGDFDSCPRAFCEKQLCLPVGLSDIPHNDSVKLYCPSCEDLYLPKSKYQREMDGAYIGTTFPHLYLMSYPYSKPAKSVRKL